MNNTKRLHALLIILLNFCLFSVNADAKQEHKVLLHQQDFAHGTVIIDKPGVYLLAEDISFNPNNAAQLKTEAYFASMPQPEQLQPRGKYDPHAFGLGFFTAILITANNVILDLNGHKLEQSKEHALLQRFYSNIELADQPFIPNQGPHNFGPSIHSAKNVIIRNGILGRASHHGIHGNGGENIWIDQVKFKDFEVAAIALNGVKGLKVTNVYATNRKDIPVLGTFSSAQFIKPYVEYLFNHDSKITLAVNGKELTVQDIRQQLRQSINNVYQDIVKDGRTQIFAVAHPDEYRLFHNPDAVIDGNSYGILINHFGFAVEGFPYQPKNKTQFAENIVIKNTELNNILANVREVVAIKNAKGDAVLDPVGSVFQIKNLDPNDQPLTLSSKNDNNAVYTGNVVANAQALVAKAILAGEFKGSHLDTSRSTFNQDIIDWIEKRKPLATLSKKYGYFCNCDSMIHVNKGVIGYRIDGAKHVELQHTSVTNIKNIGLAGSRVCGKYLTTKSHPKATLVGYGGSVVRGYSFAGSKDITVDDASLDRIRSSSGLICAFDVFTDSENVVINDVKINHLWAGLDFSRSQINPTAPPKAVGIHIGKKTKAVTLQKYSISNLFAFNQVIKVEKEN